MDKDWIILQEFTIANQANMAKAFLESEGVESMLTNELAFQTINVYTAGTGSVKMWVRESDYEVALSILLKGGYINEQDIFPRNIENLDRTLFLDKKICPFCGSRNILLRTPSDPFVKVVYKLIGLLSPAFKPVYSCENCKRAWRRR